MELPAEITVVIDLNTKIQGYKQSILIIFFYIYVVSVNNSDQYPYMEAVYTFNDHYSVWLDSSIYMYIDYMYSDWIKNAECDNCARKSKY